jgi:phage anti-repressor protein
MQNKLDIVNLIETNPLARLSKNYENKFIQKIEANFTESQQKLFISSFYTYLNYDSKTDFVIELESVWKWLGFGRKEECKRVLTKHFKQDIDYKIVFRQPAENPNTHINVGGRPKEISLMTINTFKKLCLKSDTKKADEIHDYFIKLEETLQEIVNEESNELKLQLTQKETLINEKEEKLLNQKEIIVKQRDKIARIEKRKLDKFTKKDVLYIASDQENRSVIGISIDLNEREQAYVLHNPSLKIKYTYFCKDYKTIELFVKKIMRNYVYHDRSSEWFNCTSDQLKNIVEIIIDLIDSEYNTLDDLEKFNQLHTFLNINQDLIRNTDTNTYFTESIYQNFITECCDIKKDEKETTKDILLAFKEFCLKNKELKQKIESLFFKETENNNFYGFKQAFNKEFYLNFSKLTKSTLTEFRANGKTISGFPNIKLKNKEVNKNFIKNDFEQPVYDDFLNNYLEYDENIKCKIKTSDIFSHFIKYLEHKKIPFKPTLKNNKIFGSYFTKLICKHFKIQQHNRLSFNGDANRNRNKGFYGISIKQI